MNPTNTSEGVTEDHSGLLHYKAGESESVLEAATNALERYHDRSRPMFFWHDGYFCPVDPSANNSPEDLVAWHSDWRKDCESDPKNLLALLSLPELAIGFREDEYGIWHHKSLENIRTIERAAEAAVKHRLPHAVTFFWFNEFPCPIRKDDDASKLVSRWKDWERGYGNYADNLRQFFEGMV